MAYEAEFKSIREIDLTKLERPQVAVYDCPKDYPKKAVARVMDNGKDTNMVIIADRVSDLHKDVRRYTNLVWGFRGTADEPELVGVFF